MAEGLRLDNKLLLVSLVSLAVALSALGLSLAEVIQTDIGFIVAPFFLIYLITFTLFLHYNHELEKEEYKVRSRFDIQNPYKITLYFGIFLFFFGLVGNMIEPNFLLMALVSGGLLAIVYSIAGWHDLRTKESNSI